MKDTVSLKLVLENGRALGTVRRLYYPGSLEISGMYYFDKEELKGNINIKKS